ncbi:Uncharacterised protein [Klebsiella michiganensis]|nr:Uncharacterised protein [Klebsiella michiganensis]
MMIMQAISRPDYPAGSASKPTVAMVTRVIKKTPVAPRLPLNTLSDIQPHSSVPGIPAYS